MLYSAEITKLRNQVGDVRRYIHNDWTGDGSSTVFKCAVDTYPILEQVGTYSVKIDGVSKTETNDFTLDKESGTIVFDTAPYNGAAVTLDASAVRLTDDDWMSVINDIILSMGDDFWREFVDITNFTTVANMTSVDLSVLQPNCIAVYDFQYRDSTQDDWHPVEELCNWRYEQSNNIIYLGSRDAFTESGKQLRIRGLKGYTVGTAVTDTIDVQSIFFTILEYGSIAKYWQWRYKDVVELVSKMTQEATRTPLQELVMLSDRFSRLYEQEKVKLRPKKPARIIPPYKNGGGRP